LDTPTSGRVLINNEDIHSLEPNSLCKLRNQNLGFIYQFHHLLPEFTALENILMPISISGTPSTKHLERAKYILNRLGLEQRMKHYPNQLSGGERQRVAIARATINNPKIIFADEPTGNLDNNTAHQVLDIFFELQQELKTSVVIVTHDMEIANKTNNKYRLHNSELLSIYS
ncbi:MAG: ABC transporter ATP-binding protein, partial [Burkholderiales bacterium]|nr:ABC transporter ATP-binding protein [Burkholderiales bacterium]